MLISPEDDLETLEAVLTVARRAARRCRAVTLFIDPAWPAGDPRVSRVLRRARLHPTPQETMHRCTWAVGLEGGAASTLRSGTTRPDSMYCTRSISRRCAARGSPRRRSTSCGSWWNAGGRVWRWR